jgi:hypothetical protein
MWKNLKQQIYHSQVLAAAAVTADTNTASVNVKDLNSLAFLIAVGTFAFDGSNYITVKLQHSDDNSSWADVAQENIYEGTAPAPLVINSGALDAQSHLVEYRSGKQYVRAVLDVTGTVNAPISVVAISHKPELMPPQ